MKNKKGEENMSKRIRLFILLGLFAVGILGLVIGLFIIKNKPQASDLAGLAPAEYAPGRILVKFKPNVNFYKKNKFISDYHLKIKKVISGIGINVMELPGEGTEKEYEKTFKANKDVEFAELDYKVKPEFIPNDPNYPNEWNLPKIAAPAAWDKTTGSSNIIIAILDTGVASTNRDLSTNLVIGYNAVTGTNVTNVIQNEHGSHVAGLAAAAGNNGLLVAGVAMNCKIMPIQVSTSSDGSAYDSTVASGLTWAADHGARVANISYRMTGRASVESAAKYFQSKAGIVFSSSGNQSMDMAVADSPYIITVGATDQNDVRATFSNWGNAVDLIAPGVNLYSTTWWDGLAYNISGTSGSSPVAAGVGALVLSANPSLTSAQVENILESSTDDLGVSGWDPYYGWGRVNAQKAVDMALNGPPPDTQPPSVSFNQPANGATVSGNLSIRVEARDNVFVSSTTLTLDGTTNLTPTSVQNISNTDVIYNYSLDTNTLSNGTHLLSAKAFDSSSNSNSSNISINISNVADTTPPTVSITSPTNNMSLRGSKTSISVSATDNVGVSRVELFIDNILVKTFTSTPYNFSWNIRKVASGSHTIYARAYDAKGNMGTSATITVVK